MNEGIIETNGSNFLEVRHIETDDSAADFSQECPPDKCNNQSAGKPCQRGKNRQFFENKTSLFYKKKKLGQLIG